MAKRKSTTVFDSFHQFLNGIQDTMEGLEKSKDALIQIITWVKQLLPKGGKQNE